jgi:hypothetical protein
MRGVEGKAGTRRFGFSYILLVVAIVVYLGVSAYSALAMEWKAKAEVPQIDPILQIIKGLLLVMEKDVTLDPVDDSKYSLSNSCPSRNVQRRFRDCEM